MQRDLMVWAFLLICGIVAALGFTAVSDDAHHTVRKKLIYWGWGARDTMLVREHWQAMEQMLPFDGVDISVAIDRTAWRQGRTHTHNRLDWNIFDPKPFRLDDFRPAIADLQAAKWQKFTDNFLVMNICSSGQDCGFNWFDDERWQAVLNNWRILITLAKEGGCKGIMVDLEQYNAFFLHYPTMRERADKPSGEYVAKVRERGRSLIEVTRQIFPDMALLMLYALSRPAMQPKVGALEQGGYGLLPAFVDGLMEGADSRAKFVDLCEYAYGYKERHQFLEAYHTIVNKAARFSLFPDLYRSRIRVGFGLMMDYLAGEEKPDGSIRRWEVKDFSDHWFKPEEFRQAIQFALELTDEYVWIYSQQPKLFPPENLPEAYLKAIKEVREAAGLPN